ncbi:citrate lyase subunit alpha / citrate CoA-transferase [Lutimaribacter pacificus]|uniref:Citrate lyase subunit alpha / citrate CoA-transferase n=1 Tax=Lutimaribacter pacificus TaxID=391948 RepID=A0A1H0JBP7_9RHOB|nr:citrate lyase subunit alpha [Lutimaribacter pacificus]SDO40933.1 citrate lyase subunit alpha / citrate CoA-transferase [Lutimaribacter pacificus]SHK11957.1 citrate lyase subunit alpha / citrate CoA-transferase [Lutimaribacter pacificus]
MSGDLAGYGPVVPFGMAMPRWPARAPRKAAGLSVAPDLAAALRAAGLRDGQALSFHHHLRNGDAVLNATLDAAEALGAGDLTLCPSSVFPVHAPMAAHMARGTVTGLRTGYVSGPVARALGQGALAKPAVLTTHGGRARDVESGRAAPDIAVIAAAMADRAGNLTGLLGDEAFGPMGYAEPDAAHARHVIAVTDCLVDALPVAPAIPGHRVDQIVVLPRIGAAAGIVSGTTQITRDPGGLRIADMATRLIAAAGAVRDGINFQTGAGAVSLAVAARLGASMREAGVTGGFACGGITAPLVELHRAGLFPVLRDVQCFDLAGVDSLRDDPGHSDMSASDYAHPDRPDAVVNALDVVILGAAEVDLDFNVNVTTGSDGAILGGSGGHADCAAGAGLTIIVTRRAARGFSRIVDRVACRTTPGRDIDAVVTEAGIAINPARAGLADRARAAGLPVLTLEKMRAGLPLPPPPVTDGPVVAVCEYRDGSVIDLVRGHDGG